MQNNWVHVIPMCKDREGGKRVGRFPCIQHENVFPSPGELELQGEGGSVHKNVWDCLLGICA